jgi:beta-N-acetylhexosaminidase
VDVVLGPVIDVLPDQGEPPLQRSRFFEGDPATVARYAKSYVEAWQSAGLLPVLKHFPGHGSASGDTHDVAGVTPPLGALAERDLLPYRQLAGSGAAVMLGHLTVPGLTNGTPASTSEPAVSYLRHQLGYGDALIMTDALDMAAAGGSVPDTAVDALVAGADVVLFTSTGQTATVINAIVAAVESERLSAERLAESSSRVLALLAAHGRDCE